MGVLEVQSSAGSSSCSGGVAAGMRVGRYLGAPRPTALATSNSSLAAGTSSKTGSTQLDNWTQELPPLTLSASTALAWRGSQGAHCAQSHEPRVQQRARRFGSHPITFTQAWRSHHRFACLMSSSSPPLKATGHQASVPQGSSNWRVREPGCEASLATWEEPAGWCCPSAIRSAIHPRSRTGRRARNLSVKEIMIRTRLH